MNQRSDFMAITDEALIKAPAALQQYVRKSFRKKMIFGTDCWVAFRSVSNRLQTNNRGIAPALNVDVDRFTKGLSEGTKLSDVIRRLEKNPQQCFSFFVD